MSDFLKNFRSAHSRYTGNKRSAYDGHYYPAQDRRNGNDRRNETSSHHQKQQEKQQEPLLTKVEELIPALQSLIETVTESHQLLFELKERQAHTSEEMAAALKDIARALTYMKFPDNIHQDTTHQPEDIKPSTYSAADLSQEEMKSSADEKKEVIKIMKKLRKKGGTYKEIASFLNEKHIPTFSGKGNWHAQTIHRLCSR